MPASFGRHAKGPTPGSSTVTTTRGVATFHKTSVRPKLTAAHRPTTATPVRSRLSFGGPAPTTQAPFAFTPVQGVAAFAKAGPPGPPGSGGGGGGGGTPAQVFEFDSPSSSWVCEHGLGRLPEITVYDLLGNSRPFVPIANPDLDTTVLSPNPPLAGKVVIS